MIILGTRESKLALIQAEEVRCKIEGDVCIKKIKTQADKFLKPLNEFESYGIFVKEIEEELLKKNIDLAVHSMKDIPVREVKREGEELLIGAVMKRISPYDVLVSRDKMKLFELPTGAKIGTGSIRRKLSIKNVRPDLEVVDIRGNITTRLKMVEEGKLDGIVISEAALIRLSLSCLISEVLKEEIILPAAGQGSVGIQIRKDDKEIADLISSLNDEESEVCIKAERTFLSFFGEGCRSGIGALARKEGNRIILKGCMFLDGKRIIGKEEGDNPIEVCERLYKKIKKGGDNGYC